MLVIRRKAGESIVIGDDIEIRVTEIGPRRVKLGITAPRHVAVLRKEAQGTREENLAAGRVADETELARIAARFRQSG